MQSESPEADRKNIITQQLHELIAPQLGQIASQAFTEYFMSSSDRAYTPKMEAAYNKLLKTYTNSLSAEPHSGREYTLQEQVVFMAVFENSKLENKRLPLRAALDKFAERRRIDRYARPG